MQYSSVGKLLDHDCCYERMLMTNRWIAAVALGRRDIFFNLQCGLIQVNRHECQVVCTREWPWTMTQTMWYHCSKDTAFCIDNHGWKILQPLWKPCGEICSQSLRWTLQVKQSMDLLTIEVVSVAQLCGFLVMSSWLCSFAVIKWWTINKSHCAGVW